MSKCGEHWTYRLHDDYLSAICATQRHCGASNCKPQQPQALATAGNHADKTTAESSKARNTESIRVHKMNVAK